MGYVVAQTFSIVISWPSKPLNPAKARRNAFKEIIEIDDRGYFSFPFEQGEPAGAEPPGVFLKIFTASMDKVSEVNNRFELRRLSRVLIPDHSLRQC